MVSLNFKRLSDYTDFLKYLERTLLAEAASRIANDKVHGDGGGKDLLMKINLYLNALNKEIPVEWVGYYEAFCDELKRKNDPEYQEYLRLKNKFQGE